MSDGRPLVSAIIPVYNGEAFLRETIESVLSQTYRDIECIVIDDGSTDGTGEIARSFGDSIRYVRKENGGVSSARNLGIEMASGEFVAFLDADDLWVPEKIEKQMAVFAARPDVGMVYSSVLFVDEKKKVLRKVENEFGMGEVERILLLRTPVFLTMTALVRKDVLDKVGGFDDRLSTSADADMACRIALNFETVGIDEPLAMYRQHSNQMHLNLAALEHDSTLLFEKTFGDPEVPAEIRRLRSRAYASLEMTLAVGFVRQGRMAEGLRHAARSVGFDGRELVRHASGFVRRKVTTN
jgi:glycosyltransferase involved in cell wall biosynthesis